jgi:hypothetical protein
MIDLPNVPAFLTMGDKHYMLALTTKIDTLKNYVEGVAVGQGKDVQEFPAPGGATAVYIQIISEKDKKQGGKMKKGKMGWHGERLRHKIAALKAKRAPLVKLMSGRKAREYIGYSADDPTNWDNFYAKDKASALKMARKTYGARAVVKSSNDPSGGQVNADRIPRR